MVNKEEPKKIVTHTKKEKAYPLHRERFVKFPTPLKPKSPGYVPTRAL